MIRIENEKFGIIQLALLVSLKENSYSIHDLFYFLKSLGLKSKSSFYAALNDLEEKGLIHKRKINEENFYEITKKGKKILEKISSFSYQEKFLPIFELFSFIFHKLGFSFYSNKKEFESIKDLISYRDFLRKELENVEKEIKKWKKIPVK